MSMCVCSTYSSAMRDYAIRSALPTFAPGDVVRLKSGGPKMTVVRDVDEGANYQVRWWNYSTSEFTLKWLEGIALVRAKGLDNE